MLSLHTSVSSLSSSPLNATAGANASNGSGAEPEGGGYPCQTPAEEDVGRYLAARWVYRESHFRWLLDNQ